jgi:hypothetical protein
MYSCSMKVRYRRCQKRERVSIGREEQYNEEENEAETVTNLMELPAGPRRRIPAPKANQGK